MNKLKKFSISLLCVMLVFGAFAAIPASADVTYPIMAEIASDTNIYSLPGTTGHETAGNKGQSQLLCRLTKGTEVIAYCVESDGDGDKWYKIGYGTNYENTGYAFINRGQGKRLPSCLLMKILRKTLKTSPKVTTIHCVNFTQNTPTGDLL